MGDGILYCLNLNLSMHFRVEFRSIVGRGFPTPNFTKTSPILSTIPFFKFCLNPLAPTSTPTAFCCLVSLTEWAIASGLMCYST